MTGALDPEILRYYAASAEEDRLKRGAFRLEHARTQRVLGRVLPPPPARVLDVGGAAGAYAFWLADLGYEVHLFDASERLIGLARATNESAARPLASCEVGDARHLPHDPGSADVVLMLGPLYHLTESADRALALGEAHRVLRGGGLAVVAAISRFASALDGLRQDLLADPGFWRIVEADLSSGRHLNPTAHPDYFTTAYFHMPGELRDEVRASGLSVESLLGVEGPGWLLPDLDARLDDDARRERLMWALERLEAEPSMLGASAHLLAIARRPRP